MTTDALKVKTQATNQTALMSAMDRNFDVMNWSVSGQSQQVQEHLYGSSIQGSHLKNITSYSSDVVKYPANGQASRIIGTQSQISQVKGMASSDLMKCQSNDHASWIHSSRQDSHLGSLTSSTSDVIKHPDNEHVSLINEPSSQVPQPKGMASLSSSVLKYPVSENAPWTLGSSSQEYQENHKNGIWSYLWQQERGVRDNSVYHGHQHKAKTDGLSLSPKQERGKGDMQFLSSEGEMSTQGSNMTDTSLSSIDTIMYSAGHQHGRYLSTRFQKRAMGAPFTVTQNVHRDAKPSSGCATGLRSLHAQPRVSNPTVDEMYPTEFVSENFSGPTAVETWGPLQSSTHVTGTGHSNGPTKTQYSVDVPLHNDQTLTLSVRKTSQTPNDSLSKSSEAQNTIKVSDDKSQGGSKKRDTEHSHMFDRDIPNKIIGGFGENSDGNLSSDGVRNPESCIDIETEPSQKTHVKGSDSQKTHLKGSDSQKTHVKVCDSQKTHVKGPDSQKTHVKGSDSQSKTPSIVSKDPNIPKRPSKTSSSPVSKTVQLLTDFGSNSPKPELITCEICAKYFNTLSEIEEHLSEHIDVWTVQCSLCKSRFTHQKYLDVHMEHHGQSQSFVCDLCGKSYPSAKTFKRHRRTKHEIRTPFLQPCPECDMKYVIGKYEAHCRKQHRGYSKDDEQGYKCDVCSLNFKLKSRLETHRKVHGMEKTFLCADCGKIFKSQESLRFHSKRHGPNYKKVKVQCTICDKMVDKLSLNQHMIFHSSKRKFKCEECGDSFLMKHHLTTHMKSHSDERPYVCGICQASFKLPHRLRAHRKTHGDDVET